MLVGTYCTDNSYRRYLRNVGTIGFVGALYRYLMVCVSYPGEEVSRELVEDLGERRDLEAYYVNRICDTGTGTYTRCLKVPSTIIIINIIALQQG